MGPEGPIVRLGEENMKLTREELLLVYKAVDHYHGLIKPIESSFARAFAQSFGPPPHEDYEETRELRAALREELLRPAEDVEETSDAKDDGQEDEGADEEDLDLEGSEGDEEEVEEEDLEVPGDAEEDHGEEEGTGPTIAAGQLAGLPDIRGRVISSDEIFYFGPGDGVVVDVDDKGDVCIRSSDDNAYEWMSVNSITRTGKTLSLEEADETMVISVKKFPKEWLRLLRPGLTYIVEGYEE